MDKHRIRTYANLTLLTRTHGDKARWITSVAGRTIRRATCIYDDSKRMEKCRASSRRERPPISATWDANRAILWNHPHHKANRHHGVQYTACASVICAISIPMEGCDAGLLFVARRKAAEKGSVAPGCVQNQKWRWLGWGCAAAEIGLSSRCMHKRQPKITI